MKSWETNSKRASHHEEINLNIEVYMSRLCGSEPALRANIDAALDEEGESAEVIYTRLDESQAATRNLQGSPAILIDGEPVQPTASAGFS